MALPANRDIVIYRGDPYDHEFTFALNGVPIDFNDPDAVEGWAQFRPEANSADAVAVDFTVDVTGGSIGKIRIHLDAEQTADLPSEGGYDLELLYAGRRSTWVRGNVFVENDYTRVP